MNPNMQAPVLNNRFEMTTSSKMDGQKTEIIINMEMAKKPILRQKSRQSTNRNPKNSSHADDNSFNHIDSSIQPIYDNISPNEFDSKSEVKQDMNVQVVPQDFNKNGSSFISLASSRVQEQSYIPFQFKNQLGLSETKPTMGPALLKK